MASAPIGLAYVDSELRYVYINEWLAGLSGRPTEYHLGKTVQEAFPTVAPQIEPDYRHVLATGEQIFEREVAGNVDTTAEGIRYWVCSYSPVRGGEGQIIGVVSIVQEITERRQAEEARLQFSRELDEKNRELESIVYVASHDLRSPLVNIQGFGQELVRSCEEIQELLQSQSSHIQPEALAKLTKILDTDLPEALHFIQVSATKMDVLLAGLLKLSRLGRQPLSVQNVDMNEMMAAVLASMEFQIQRAGAEVTVEALPPCSGDENQLNQLFTNILDNSLKYSHPSRPCTIRISGREAEKGLIYCIEDNGIGIPAGHLEKVFELFYRLQPRDTVGEGLGLTIAQRIATRHKGNISIESQLDIGSKVSVFLPRPRSNSTSG